MFTNRLGTLVLALATACLATIALAAVPPGLHVDLDRFKNRSEITANESTPSPAKGGFNENHLWRTAIVTGANLTQLDFRYWHADTEWRYLNCHDMAFLVDGKPFDITTTFDSEMQRSLTLEKFRAVLTREYLAQWASAKKIEYRVCQDEGVFPEAFMKNIRDFGPELESTRGDLSCGNVTLSP